MDHHRDWLTAMPIGWKKVQSQGQPAAGPVDVIIGN